MQLTKADSTLGITAGPASLTKGFNRDESGVTALGCERVQVFRVRLQNMANKDGAGCQGGAESMPRPRSPAGGVHNCSGRIRPPAIRAGRFALRAGDR
jgi:hypothetical protein